MAIIERVIGSQANAEIAAVLERHGFGPNVMMVYDDLTWLAAGQAIQAQLDGKYTITPHPLGRDVSATLALANEIKKAASGVDGLIAVGAGTINDLTKYAAAQLNKPYLCVATAASMNGYTSATASLTVDDFKHSHFAKPPRAVIADIDVIAAAPKRLARCGLGDTLCRSSVEADMVLSHFLFGTSYPRTLFEPLRRHEPALIAQASALTANHVDPTYITLLMNALLDAGDAMTAHGSSAVASQGEHMIAHTIELMYGSEIPQVSHGELIAVTTLTMRHLQQQMLLSVPILKPLPCSSVQFLRVFGKHSADRLLDAYQKKLVTPERAEYLTKHIQENWELLKKALTEITIPAGTIDRAFVLAGVPTRPHDIKLAVERYQNAVTYAHMSRDRFTFLDLAAMNAKRA